MQGNVKTFDMTVVSLSDNMNIGNAYRRARNALCFEKSHFAVTVQFDNIEAKKHPKNQSISTVKILVPESGTGFSQ